jgi:hypothetical protein
MNPSCESAVALTALSFGPSEFSLQRSNFSIQRFFPRSPWSPNPLLTRFFAGLRRSTPRERPTSSISLNRPLVVRFANDLLRPVSMVSRFAVLRFLAVPFRAEADEDFLVPVFAKTCDLLCFTDAVFVPEFW